MADDRDHADADPGVLTEDEIVRVFLQNMPFFLGSMGMDERAKCARAAAKALVLHLRERSL